MTRTPIIALAAAVALAGGLAAAPALAHHAINAQFDVTQLGAKQGVLTGIDNVNPHAYWHFDIKGPNGEIEKWNVESVAPNALRRAGIAMKDEIKVGTAYNFSIAPSRNGSHTGLLLLIDVNGKTVKLTAN
jgi:hypothetical protein